MDLILIAGGELASCRLLLHASAEIILLGGDHLDWFKSNVGLILNGDLPFYPRRVGLLV